VRAGGRRATVLRDLEERLEAERSGVLRNVSQADKSNDNSSVQIVKLRERAICFFMRKLSVGNNTFIKNSKEL
jgi:hypothetical protein